MKFSQPPKERQTPQHFNYQSLQTETNMLKISPNKWGQIKHEQPLLSSSRSSNSKICPYENSVTCSQVADRIGQFCTKNGVNSNNRNEQKQKQRIRNIKADRDQVINCVKKQLMVEFQQMIEEHRKQTSNSLREAVIKINQNIKRDCVTSLSKNFVPLSFTDLSERQFEEVDKKIKTLEGILRNTNTQIQNENDWKEKKTIEDKIRLFDKQFREIKASLNNENRYDEQIKQVKKDIQKIFNNFTESFREVHHKINIKDRQVQELSINLSNNEKQTQKIYSFLSTLKQSQQQIQVRVKELTKYISSESKQKQKQKQKSQRINFHKQKQTVTNQKVPQLIISPSKIQNKVSLDAAIPSHQRSMSFMISLQSLSDISSPRLKKVLPESLSSIKDIKSLRYILDVENNLMDDVGNYILDEEGKHIQLTLQQVKKLQQSNLIKFRDES